MMSNSLFVAAVGCVLLSCAHALGTSNFTCAQPPPASNYVNSLYEGRWYEIGRVQTPGGAAFQVGCMCTTNDFTSDEPVQGDGSVSYACRRFTPDNDPTFANATLVDTGVPGAFLQVYPYPNASALNYYVIYIDEDSAVEYDCDGGDAGSNHNYCVHILSRTPSMDPDRLQELLDYSEELGLNPDGVEYNPTEHEGCW